jgi:hypothetical protein
MNTENDLIILEEARSSRKRYLRSLEYGLLANLALQQYTAEGRPRFDRLLAIPQESRLPGQLAHYGLKRLHRLVKLLLQEFCYGIALPKSKKLSDTQLSVCACDLLLAATEDQLALEDLIVFLELARNGAFGRFRGMVTHWGIMQKLEQYRTLRHQAWVPLREQQVAAQKALGPQERLAPQPRSIRQLFEEEGGRIIPFPRPAS